MLVWGVAGFLNHQQYELPYDMKENFSWKLATLSHALFQCFGLLKGTPFFLKQFLRKHRIMLLDILLVTTPNGLEHPSHSWSP